MAGKNIAPGASDTNEIWSHHDQIKDPDAIKAFEHKFHITFPKEYVDTVLNWNGGEVFHDKITAHGEHFYFASLLSFNLFNKGKDDISEIERVNNNDVQRQTNPKLIAFADGGNGEKFYFDFGKGGKIVWIDVETSGDKVYPICDSFKEFLLILKNAKVSVAKEDLDAIDIDIAVSSGSAEIESLLLSLNDCAEALYNLQFISDHFNKLGLTNEGMHLINDNDALASALKMKIPSMESESIDIPSSMDLTVVQEGIGEVMTSLKDKAKGIIEKIGASFKSFFTGWFDKTGKLVKELEEYKKTKFSGDGSDLDEEKWLKIEMVAYTAISLFNMASSGAECLVALKNTTKLENLKSDDIKVFDLPAINKYLIWFGKEVIYTKIKDNNSDYFISHYEVAETDDEAKRKVPIKGEASLKELGFSFKFCKEHIDAFIEALEVTREGKAIEKFIESTIAHNKNAGGNDQDFIRYKLPTIQNNIRVTVAVAKFCLDWLLGATTDFTRIVGKLK